jgi:hypothetical protein
MVENAVILKDTQSGVLYYIMYIVDNNPCNPDPCTHGQCVASGETYTCTCNSGYSGTICDGR